MFPDDSGIKPRVVKMELYETSSPPGNNGGAVSGAAPCPFDAETQSKAAKNAQRPFSAMAAEWTSDSQDFSSSETVVSRAHVSVSRGAGGQTRYEEEGW